MLELLPILDPNKDLHTASASTTMSTYLALDALSIIVDRTLLPLLLVSLDLNLLAFILSFEMDVHIQRRCREAKERCHRDAEEQ